MLSPALLQLLDEALASLAAWHVIESLARSPARRRPLAGLVSEAALDAEQAEQAIDALAQRGLIARVAHDEWAFTPEYAAALSELCACVEADRDLHRRVIKQAARRDWAASRLKITLLEEPFATAPLRAKKPAEDDRAARGPT